MQEIVKLFETFQNISLSINFHHVAEHDAAWKESKTNAHYTLWCVTQGNVYIEMNGKQMKAETYDAVLFYPGEEYDAYTDLGGCQFIFLFFTLESGSSIDVFSSFSASGIYSGETFRKFNRRFCQWYQQKRNASTLSMLTLLVEAAKFMAVLFQDGVHTAFGTGKISREENSFTDILLYIKEHFREEISVGDLAKKFGISEKYFISIFHKNAGISPKQYLIECRMKYAADKLLETKKSVAEIAQDAGYVDLYSFSKAFKKYFGEAPTLFRKAYEVN